MASKKEYPKRKVAQDTIIVFVFFLIAALFAYIFRIILARTLTLNDYGLFFAVIAFFGVITIFRDLGIGQSAMYYVPRFVAKKQRSKVKEYIDKILKIEFWTSTLSMLLIIALADFLVQNYFHYGSVATIIIFAIAYFFNSIELNVQLLFNAFQNQKLYALHNLVRALLILVLAVLVSITSYKNNINMYIYAQILAYVVVLIFFGTIFYKKIYSSYEKKSKDTIVIKELFLFGIIATGAQLCYVFITSTDTLFLTYMTNLENVGLYNSVIPIVTLILYLTMALTTVITPRVSELIARKKFDEIRFLWEKSIKYILIVTLPLIGILVLYPQLILRLMFGESFVAASTTLVIMASGIIFFGLSQINMSFLLSIIGPKNNLVIYAVATVANIILNLILIPKYSIAGAATATIISYALLLIMSTTVLLKIIKADVRVWHLIMMGVSVLAYVLFFNYLKTFLDIPFVLELVLVLLLSGGFYLLLLFGLRVVTIQEIKGIKKAILK